MRQGEKVAVLQLLMRISVVVALVAIAAFMAIGFDPFGWTW
jgi:hypothetical protein